MGIFQRLFGSYRTSETIPELSERFVTSSDRIVKKGNPAIVHYRGETRFQDLTSRRSSRASSEHCISVPVVRK